MIIKRLVFDGEIRVENYRYIVVPPRSYLVKPLYVYIGSTEKYLLSGIYPFNPPLILGSSGVVRIIEASPGVKQEYTGRIAIISPLGRRGVLSRDLDGLLSSYTYVYPDYIYSFVPQARINQSILPFISLASMMVSKSSDTVLIIGCDITGVISALLLGLRNHMYHIYCEQNYSIAKRLNLQVVKNISDLNPEYDSVIVSTPYNSIVSSIINYVTTNKLIINPLYRGKYIFIGNNNEIQVFIPSTIKASIESNQSYKVIDRLKKYVRIIRVENYDMEKIRELLPPHGLGYIVVFD